MPRLTPKVDPELFYRIVGYALTNFQKIDPTVHKFELDEGMYSFTNNPLNQIMLAMNEFLQLQVSSSFKSIKTRFAIGARLMALLSLVGDEELELNGAICHGMLSPWLIRAAATASLTGLEFSRKSLMKIVDLERAVWEKTNLHVT